MRVLILLVALAGGATAAADTVLLRNVHVVPMHQPGVLTDREVLVVDGRIERIGPSRSNDPAPGITVIDGAGGYLLPGLAEMHAHIPAPGQGRETLERVLALFALNGVTTVRGMLGHPAHLALRRDIADGKVFGPRLFTSGPSFNGNSVTGPEQATRRVEAQVAAGYDFLKIHPGLTAAEFEAIARTAAVSGIAFEGHVTADVGLVGVLDAGQRAVDHLDGYMQALLPEDVDEATLDPRFFAVSLAGDVDETRLAAVARRTAELGAWNAPTLTLIDNFTRADPAQALMARPELAFVDTATRQAWQRSRNDLRALPGFDAKTLERAADLRLAMVAALHEAGAGLLLASDAPQVFNVPGFSTHRELALMVQAGLSPYEALATGTTNAARYFGEDEEFGAVREGLAADLVLVADNPLETLATLRRPLGVMLRGRWLPRAELDDRLAALERP